MTWIFKMNKVLATLPVPFSAGLPEMEIMVSEGQSGSRKQSQILTKDV